MTRPASLRWTNRLAELNGKHYFDCHRTGHPKVARTFSSLSEAEEFRRSHDESFHRDGPTRRVGMSPSELAESVLSRCRPGDNGCLVWTGKRAGGRYGYITVGGKRLGSHRVAYAGMRGPIPAGMMVCHTCDNPPCCNPDHLFLGTARDNAIDMVQKGRDGAVTMRKRRWKRIMERLASGESLRAIEALASKRKRA